MLLGTCGPLGKNCCWCGPHVAVEDLFSAPFGGLSPKALSHRLLGRMENGPPTVTADIGGALCPHWWSVGDCLLSETLEGSNVIYFFS